MMDKKSLYIVVGAGIFTSIMFLLCYNSCIKSTLDYWIYSMGGMGLFIIPSVMGFYKFKKEVNVDV